MTKSFLDGKVVLHSGDCRDVMRTLPDNSVDAIVTDPPYALVQIGRSLQLRQNGDGSDRTGQANYIGRGFMGKKWDTGEAAFAVEFWAEALRVLKPGGHVVAFGGTRTYHRLACAIEDGGFEIRDCLMWVYGSGFPKSHNVSKAIDKAAGAKREIIGDGKYAARKPNGSGGVVSVGLTRTAGHVLTSSATDAAKEWDGWGTALKPAVEPIVLARKPLDGTVAANVLKWGTGAINVDGCRVEADGRPARVIDPKESANGAVYAGRQMAGSGFDGGSKAVGVTDLGRFPANLLHDGSAEVVGLFPESDGQQGDVRGTEPSGVTADIYGAFNGRVPQVSRGDSGSAARFFYTAKADSHDRIASKHPTVKPVDLMQWLVRLVCPKGGLVLDPFAGTGTTGEAAWREGVRAILIEREVDYQQDIARRMDLADKPSKRQAVAKTKGAIDDLGPLFASPSAVEAAE